MSAMHIGHVALRATDPERSASFLSDILGMRRTFEDDGQIMVSCNEKHHEVQLLAADAPGVDHVGLELESEAELEMYRDRLIAAGATILSEDAQEPGIGKAFRAVGPLGLVFELYTAMVREPLTVERYMPPLGRRLGHVSFAAPDCSELLSFLTDVLDFRVSDSLDGRIHWLRCDQEHHGIALVTAGTKPEMHHYAFQLDSLGAIGRYADNLALLGKRMVWGPGRHGPGRNIYTYIPDPDNTIVETYADMLEISSEAGYTAIDWSEMGDDALNLWGQMPPAEWRSYGVPILAPATAGQTA